MLRPRKVYDTGGNLYRNGIQLRLLVNARPVPSDDGATREHRCEQVGRLAHPTQHNVHAHIVRQRRIHVIRPRRVLFPVKHDALRVRGEE